MTASDGDLVPTQTTSNSTEDCTLAVRIRPTGERTPEHFFMDLEQKTYRGVTSLKLVQSSAEPKFGVFWKKRRPIGWLDTGTDTEMHSGKNSLEIYTFLEKVKIKYKNFQFQQLYIYIIYYIESCFESY